MKAHILKAFVVLALLAAWVPFAAAGLAQGSATHLSALEVDLWPEYDRAEMLVILKLTLGADVSLPASLEVRVPANATIWAVAEQQVNNLVTVAYEERTSGDWKIIALTATVPEVQVEYYDPSLAINQDARQFKYLWPGGFRVDTLGVTVQQPFDASEMKINPNLGSGQVNNTDGLTYYTAQIGALTESQVFQATIDYRKATDKLSAESITVQPAQPLNEDSSPVINPQVNLPGSVIWLIVAGVAGLAMIIGGATWYIIASRNEPRPSRRAKRPVQRKDTSAQKAEVIYCQQCGKRAAAGDRFCRQCGTRLRVD